MTNSIRLVSPACLVCLAVVFTAGSASAADLSPERSRAQADVQGALECEANGDQNGRDKRLAAALQHDPDCPSANWHSGRVRHNDRWLTIDEAQTTIGQSSHLRTFQSLRQKYSGTVEGELKLARWCRDRRPDVARTYYNRLLNHGKLSPRIRREVIDRLDLVTYRGSLVPEPLAARHAAQTRRMQQVWKKWFPQLKQWEKQLARPSLRQREYVASQLQQLNDREAVFVVESFAASPQPPLAKELVRLASKFPELEATRALAAFAVASPHPAIRSDAVAELRQRPVHEFIPLLLRSLTAPIESEWRVVRLSDGSIRHLHVLTREGADVKRLYVSDHVSAPAVADAPYFEPRKTPFTTWWLDSAKSGEIPDADVATEYDLRRAARRIDARVEARNQPAYQRNQRVFEVLRAITGLKLSDKPVDWWDWWNEYNEVHYEKPTRTVYDQSQSWYLTMSRGPYYRAVSCFRAGVPVATESGPLAIEKVQIGDRVLTQHPETGELAFRVVLGTTIRRPSPMIAITLNGEVIETTPGHPIWVTNLGWRMAKHLKPGDQLHHPGGIVTIDRIAPVIGHHEAYNLIVDGVSNYFVGQTRVLVHDNTYRKPTRARVPGDRSRLN